MLMFVNIKCWKVNGMIGYRWVLLKLLKNFIILVNERDIFTVYWIIVNGFEFLESFVVLKYVYYKRKIF